MPKSVLYHLAEQRAWGACTSGAAFAIAPVGAITAGIQAHRKDSHPVRIQPAIDRADQQPATSHPEGAELLDVLN